MSLSEECLLLLYGSDGEQWARFIASRLSSPQYNIKSVLRNMSCTTQENETDVPEVCNSITTTKSTDIITSSDIINSNSRSSNINNLTNENISGETLEQQDSGRSSGSTINEFSNLFECIANTRGTVVFLSPDSIIMCPFPFDVSFLNPKRSVFLFLGVDIEEVRTLFGEKSDFIFKCKCCVIGADEGSVCDAMVQIIEAYEDIAGSSILDEEDEDDDDIYVTPGCPRQLNRIERVFPKELTERDRDVYILLERAAEDDVSVILEGPLTRKIPMTSVCERLYKFTLPNNASGEVFFKVDLQNHCIGAESVRTLSKCERLKAIIFEEVNPLALLASAVGLDSEDLGGIDTALAFKLQQLAPAMTFQRLFPCEEALCRASQDDRADVMYPSLLHFAADFNLRAFCSELLRYPGMLAAALTENVEGEYPSQIAARKGYTHLESDLVHFVEGQSNSRTKRPQPHVPTKTSDYINELRSPSPISGLYIDMFNLNLVGCPSLEKQCDVSDEDFISPLSESSENVFMLGHDEVDSRNLREAGRLSICPEDDSLIMPTPIKALKLLDVQEEDIVRSRSSTVTSVQSRSESPGCKQYAATLPNSVQSSGAGPVYSVDSPLATMRTVREDPYFKETCQHESKQRTFTKIVSFFGKIKNKRSNSDCDNVSVSSRGIKKSNSSKSDKSSKGMQETDSYNQKKKPPSSENTERDSGSYSDEDKDKTLSNNNRRNGKPKDFGKERGKVITRRLSQRAHAASKECVRDAPELPSGSLRMKEFADMNEHY